MAAGPHHGRSELWLTAPILWGGELPNGLAREMRADDYWILMLRSRRPGILGTFSEAVTRGKDQVRVELARIKGLVAALVEAATEVSEYLQGRSAAWAEGLVKARRPPSRGLRYRSALSELSRFLSGLDHS